MFIIKKYSIFILLGIFVLILSGCGRQDIEKTEDSKLTIATSIVPVTSFVKAVAGDNVEVLTVIPSGNSPANYQPTTTEMQVLSDADIYFVIQVPAEEANILPKITNFNKDIKLVNLREAVSEQYPLRYMDEHDHEENHSEDDEHEAEMVDPHIWLSPQRVIVMVQTIADELSKLDPENTQTYQMNAQTYMAKLNMVDASIKEIVKGMDNKVFMIYHGAYGYYADDYGLTMISLEADGKAATAAHMQEVVERAKVEDIHVIFYQDEFDDNQAETIAEEIGGIVKKTEPLSPNYIELIKAFTNALVED